MCGRHTDHRVNCLPGTKVKDVAHHLDSLVDGAEELSVVMVHAGTNDMEQHSLEGLETKFRLLDR